MVGTSLRLQTELVYPCPSFIPKAMEHPASPMMSPQKGFPAYETAVRAGQAGSKRKYHGRIFPKASLRALVTKAGIGRVMGGKGRRNAYTYMDKKMFFLMEKALLDADAIVLVGSGKTIKERHIIQALGQRGALGLASESTRRELAIPIAHKMSKKEKAQKKAKRA